ncbi:MAG: IS21 family transposase [Candidatus Binatia bacterium]
MLSVLKRHAIQVLVAAGHLHVEVARFVGVDERTVRRVAKEAPVTELHLAAPLPARVGRPSKAEPYRQLVTELVTETPTLLSVEVLRRARLAGYAGGKSALYELIAALRPAGVAVEMRFEGLPGEFSQHDFGQVDVAFTDGSRRRVHFFASRLKWSRWAEVTVVPDQTAETLIRTLADHFVAMGGVPLCAVFDRPKTVALQWKKNGEVTEWNPIFAYAALEIGFTAEVCWPYQPQQKGSVEAIVKWVKGSFFTQRRFHDLDDLLAQLAEWLHAMNTERPSRATGIIPAARIDEERSRLRALRVQPAELALRIPISVGPTAEVVHEAHSYSMPPEAAGLPGTLYLYQDRVRIVAGRHEVRHERQRGRGTPSRLPEHRAAHLAALSGARGKRYLKRQHLFETGEAAVRFLTEIVHRHPHGAWARDVDALHEMLQQVGPEAMHRAFRAALDIGRISTAFVAECLGRPHPTPSLFPAEVP